MKHKPNREINADDQDTIIHLKKSLPSAKIRGFPVTIDRRFKYIKDLGQGGSGKICLAYDDKLQRKVALKFLISSNPLKTQMLLQEARAQAQLKHENICQIYEVNESNDQIYLVMQYIQGDPIHTISAQLNLEQKLLILHKILDGLQQAHQQGILHRDIKPSNILLEISDQGMLKPYLIDFGLAHRDYQGQQLAQSAGLGTPYYMAPEQFSCDATEIDRRADIYSTGATLYHLLTGEPPQQQDASDTHLVDTTSSGSIKNVTTGLLSEPACNIPIDLQSLMLKCLSIDPIKRYPSAKALADDIRLYLQGEPIRAHKGLIYQLNKKIRKHKLLVTFGSLLLLTLISSGSWFVFQNRQQNIREQMIQNFSAKIENMEARVRFSYMAPRHDLSPEIANWNREINEIEQDIVNLGNLAYGPGHYAIGRMYFSLQEYNNAVRHLQLAWHSGFQQARVAYFLALSNGALYQQHKNIINNLPSKSVRKEKLVTLEKLYRRPSIEYLEQGMHASPYKYLAQATLYFYQDELEKSLHTLQQSPNFPSWFYDHKVLSGDIYQSMAENFRASHNNEQVKKFTTLALNNYQQASLIAPSDFELRLKSINAYISLLKSFIYGKMGEFDHEYKTVQRLIEHAKENNTQDYQSYYLYGQLLLIKSKYESQYSGDSAKTLQLAINQFSEANERAPNNADVWLSLALAHTNKYNALQERGLDIENQFNNAQHAFKQIKTSQKDYFFYNTYGNFLRTHALTLSKLDAEQSDHYFTQSLTAYNHALALQPNKIGALINAGSLLRLWANSFPAVKAKEKLILAIEKYQNALQLNPQHFVANYLLGVSYRHMAQIEDALHNGNHEQINLANRYLSNALKQDSDHPFANNEIAILEKDQAVYHWQKGYPYRSFLTAAINRIDNSLIKNPDNHILHSTRASIYFNWCQLDYFSDRLTDDLIEKTYQAINTSNHFSRYNNIEKQLLDLISQKTIPKEFIDDITELDDRNLLFKALWHSQNQYFDESEMYFSRIKQLHPSLLWQYRRRHLLHWEKNSDDLEKKRVNNELKKLDNTLFQHYPAFFN